MTIGYQIYPAPARAPRELIATLAPHAKEQSLKEESLLDGIAAGSVDRRWVDKSLAAKGCTL